MCVVILMENMKMDACCYDEVKDAVDEENNRKKWLINQNDKKKKACIMTRNDYCKQYSHMEKGTLEEKLTWMLIGKNVLKFDKAV